MSIKPHLDDQALSVFEHYLSLSKVYVEFGCGGSTISAVRAGVQQIFTVENDPAWRDRILQESAPILQESQRLDITFIDCGVVHSWGWIPKPTRDLASAYVNKIWTKVEAPVDLVLVDGRFRTACALAAHSKIDENTIVLLDDGDRAEYADIFTAYNVESMHGRMKMLRKKPGYNITGLLPKHLDSQK
jgi:hypothetical protein